jgi:uncharacterized protein (DUF58 family)
VALLLAFVLVDLGALGGNNLIVLVACVAWAVLVVDLLVGRWNVAGVSVGWRLPEELYAGQGCRGAFVVDSGRRPGPGPRTRYALEVTDGVASAEVPRVVPGEEAVQRVFWRLPARGPFVLDGVTVRSRFPFGLFEHRAQSTGRAEGLCYAAPLSGRLASAGEVEGVVHDGAPDRREQAGDFRELRPYRPGDRIRSIHWPTTARVGEPMVVVRGGERSDAVRVSVRTTTPGPALEEAVSRATGAVLEATAGGRAVGLELPGDPTLLRPGGGTRWRRRLLDALALYDGGQR